MIKHSPAKALTVAAKVSRKKMQKGAPTIKPSRPVSNSAQLWWLRPPHNRLGWQITSRAFHALASRVWDGQDTHPVFVQSLEATPCCAKAVKLLRIDGHCHPGCDDTFPGACSPALPFEGYQLNLGCYMLLLFLLQLFTFKGVRSSCPLIAVALSAFRSSTPTAAAAST